MRCVSWALAFIFAASAAFAADPVEFFTVTSRDGENVVEWLNPASSVSFTRIIGRTDRFATGPADFAGGDFVEDVVGGSGEHGRAVHVGMKPGVCVYYAAFVNDGAGFSPVSEARVHTIDPSRGVVWAFHIGAGATSMAPPGIGINVVVGANDGAIYAVERGPSGGIWPVGFIPLAVGQPVQHRPPVIPLSGLTSASHFALVSAQDGVVRAVDVETGDLLWASEDEGMVQAAPAASFQAYGGPDDLVFFGSRNAGVDNLFHAIKAEDGGDEWTFQNDDGGLGLGIISGGASVDYAKNRLYFTSHERVAGASTVFALEIESGEWIWRRPVGDVSNSATTRGDVLYVGNDTGLLYTLDLTSGRNRLDPVDTGDGAIKGFVFPDFFGSRIYFSTNGAVHCFEDTGAALERRWTYKVAAPSTPVYPPGSTHLWVGSGDGSLHQIDVTTGSLLDAPDAVVLPLGSGKGGIGAPSYDVANDLIYAGSEGGVTYAVSAPY